MVTPMHYFSTFGGKYLPEPATGRRPLIRGGAPDEEDEFFKLLWRRFPDFCKTIFSPVVNGVDLNLYFDSADLEAHGVTYLQTIINQIAFANHARRDKAREFAHEWTKANAEQFFAMTKPPEARDALDDKDLDLYDHMYVEETLKEIWHGRQTVMKKDVVEATPTQPSGRGNFNSDPEQYVQDQIHNPLDPANVVGVTKDLVLTPVDGNPSSQLHIRNPVPVTDRFDGLREFLEMRLKQNIEDLEDFDGDQPSRRLRLITTSFGVVHETTTVTLMEDRIKLETNTEIYPMSPVVPQQVGKRPNQEIVEDSSIANVRTQYIKRKAQNQQSASQAERPSVPQVLPVADSSTRLGLPPEARKQRMPQGGNRYSDERLPGLSVSQERRAQLEDRYLIQGVNNIQATSDLLITWLVLNILQLLGFQHPQDTQLLLTIQTAPKRATRDFGLSNDHGFQTQQCWDQPGVASHEYQFQPVSALPVYDGPIETSPTRRLRKSNLSAMDPADFTRELCVSGVPGTVNLKSLMEFFQILPAFQISDPILSFPKAGAAQSPFSRWYFYLRFRSAHLAEEARATLSRTPCPLLSNGRQWLTVGFRQDRNQRQPQASSSYPEPRTNQDLQMQLQRAEHQAVIDSSSANLRNQPQHIPKNVDRKAGSVQSIEPSKENAPPETLAVSSTITHQAIPPKQRQQRPIPSEESQRGKVLKKQKDKQRVEVPALPPDTGPSKAMPPASVGPAEIHTPLTNLASEENVPVEPVRKHRQSFQGSMPCTESRKFVPPRSVKSTDDKETPSHPTPEKMPRRSSLYEILQDVKNSKLSKPEPEVKEAKDRGQVQDDDLGIPKQELKQSKASKPASDMKENPETIQIGNNKLEIQDQDVKKNTLIEGDELGIQKKDIMPSKTSKPVPEATTSDVKPQAKVDTGPGVKEPNMKKSKAPKRKPETKGKKEPTQPQESRQEIKTQPESYLGLQVELFAAGFNTVTEAPTSTSSEKAIEPVRSQPADSALDSSTQALGTDQSTIAVPTLVVPAEEAMAESKVPEEGRSSQMVADKSKEGASTQLSRKPIKSVPPAVPDMRKLNELLMEEQRAKQGDTEAEKVKVAAKDTAHGEIKQSAQSPKKSKKAPRQSKLIPEPGPQHRIEDSGSSRQNVELESQPAASLDPEQSAASSTPKRVDIAEPSAQISSIYQTPPSVGLRPPPVRTDLTASRDDDPAYETAKSAFATPNLFSDLQEITDGKIEDEVVSNQVKAFNPRSPSPEYSTPPEHSPEASPKNSITSKPYDHGSQGSVESPISLQRGTLKQMHEDTRSDVKKIPSPLDQPLVSGDETTITSLKASPDEATARLSNTTDLSSETLKGDSLAADEASDRHVEEDVKQVPPEAAKASKEAARRLKKNQKRKEKKEKEKEKRGAVEQRQQPNSKPDDVASSSAGFWTPSTASQSETSYANPTPKLTDPFTENEAPEKTESRIPNVDGAADSKRTYTYPAVEFSRMANDYTNVFVGDYYIDPVDQARLVGSFGVFYHQSKPKRRDIFKNWDDFQTVILKCCEEAIIDPSQLMEVMYTEEQQEFEKGNASVEDLHELRAEIDAYNAEPKGFKYTMDSENDLSFADKFALRLSLCYLKPAEALASTAREESPTPSATEVGWRNTGDPKARLGFVKSDEALSPRTRGDFPTPSGAENVRRNITDPKARLAFYADQQQAFYADQLQNEAPAPAQRAVISHSPLDFMASLIKDPSTRQAFLAKHRDDHSIPQSLDFPIPPPSQLCPPTLATAATSTEKPKDQALEDVESKDKTAETTEPKTPSRTPTKPFLHDQPPALSPHSIKIFTDLSQPADPTTSKPLSKIINNTIHIPKPDSDGNTCQQHITARPTSPATTT
ncbi:GDP dissociation inhibitor [Physcia stellaris]|nr:GDP dissociation inhibitor [Physcia stellaris]